MENVFVETFEDLGGSSGQLDFEAFEHLVMRARQHHQRIVAARVSDILRDCKLDSEALKEHADELVLLHESFQRMDPKKVGSLGWDDIRMLLIEYNLLPRDDDAQSRVIEDFAKLALPRGGRLGFREFLQLVRSLRRDYILREEYSLKEMFKRLDKDRSSTLGISEISNLLEEFGVQPKCWEDQMQIRRVLDQIDEDQSNDYSFAEFCHLVQRVREYLATAARRRQRLMAIKLGFGDRQVAELRDVFFTLDSLQQGFLTVEQLRKALDTLKRPMSPEDLRKLVAEIDIAGTGLVDFQSFLHFFKAVAPASLETEKELTP